MSFFERLTASIRGVEFLLNTVDGKGGRRAIPREYPKRENGWTEDNGAVLTNEQIQAKVVGRNYLEELRALLDALNQPGTCEMIHPWWGVRTVQVGEVSHRLDNEEDGVAYVTFTVWEAGKRLFPSAAVDTAATMGNAAGVAQAAAEQSFADKFLTGIDNMGLMVDTFLDDLDEFTRGLPTLPDEFRAWTDRLLRTKDSIGGLLAYPGSLAREITGIVEDVMGVVTDPIRALSVYDQVIRRWEGMRAELAITGGLPSGITSSVSLGTASSVPTIDTPTELNAALANGDTFTQLISRAAASSAASALASANFSSGRMFTAELPSNPASQDSIGGTAITSTFNMGRVTIGQSLTGSQVSNPQSRPVVLDGVVGADRNLLLTSDDLEFIANKVAARLADLAMEAVEADESDVWRSLRDLRLAVLNDSRERATQLPRRRALVLATTTPAALLAWQQYGNAEYRDRLVSSNNLRDPAFITPTTKVEVIDG
ncbi:DNA circularization protein [Aeromonas enteropelogenes]|uniref:DNA circularization protein n=1 Tax=Aeromonas enteropelogenes TaxID=29489 RepID=UPI003BA23C39